MKGTRAKRPSGEIVNQILILSGFLNPYNIRVLKQTLKLLITGWNLSLPGLFLLMGACQDVKTNIGRSVDNNNKSSSGNPLKTNFGGNGDENLLAPNGYSEVFNLEEAYQRSSFKEACAKNTVPSARPLSHLTKIELENTLKDLLVLRMGEETANTVLKNLASKIARIPEDKAPESDHSLLANAGATDLQNGHVDAYFFLAIDLANQLNTQRTKFIGACATTITEACFKTFLETHGHLIHRRPLKPEDLTHYLGVFRNLGLKGALSALFVSPNFIFHQELNNSAGQGIVPLDAYELASRLSYSLWGTMPDTELFSKAQNSSLLDEKVFEGQARRLLAHPRARANFRNFLTQWLQLDNVPEIDLSDITTFLMWNALPGAPAAIDAPKIKNQAISEILDLAEHYVFDAQPSSQRLSGFLLSKKSNAGEELSTAIYDSAAQSRDSKGWFNLTDSDNRGILGRAALQSIDARTHRPIMKGVRVLDRLLCRPMEVPADNATPKDAIVEPDFSARERTVAITEIEKTTCYGCHQMINPLGFAQGSFDPFGRKDLRETIVDPVTKKVLTTKTINTDVKFNINRQEVKVSGPGELSQVLAESFEVHRCFSRFWIRHLNKSRETLGDSCQMQATYEALEKNNAGIQAGLLGAILHPNFKVRSRK